MMNYATKRRGTFIDQESNGNGGEKKLDEF